ncbi:hypothetical protein A6U97_27585 [Agrobacterium tumefaciens]|uniref:SEC-C metal-binding domain-containing protein n=1 Tax=Agrobacterium tumefaciens TaxID=358 RepID=UPI0008100367|nr:hypothetical protein A6U97_27585 [Agrobacterium tumefaciens]
MPAISTELFKKSYTTTPKALDSAIIDFCREVSPGVEPRYLPVRPDPISQPSECFNNVMARVSKEGGNLVYGWLVWEWPNVFIEAEHHAVWQSSDMLVDITPHVNGENEILFLPDPKSTYDFVGQKRRINIKRSHERFASVSPWIAATDVLQETIERHSTGNTFTIDRDELAALARNVQNSLGAVFVDIARHTRPNDRCFCLSGRKFKMCCSNLVQL